MITIIIIGAVLYYFYNKQTATVQTPSLAGQNLSTVGTPSASSSTPAPTPTTPPFYQTNNAATPSEPVTTESFNPIDLTAPLASSNMVPVNKVATQSHNNVIIENKLRIGFNDMPDMGNLKVPTTELSSVSEETDATMDIGTPVV